MRRRPVVAALVATILSSLWITGAHAGRCDGEVGEVVLLAYPGPPGGYPVLVPTANTGSKSIGCDVLGAEDPNTNYIYPGSTVAMVRYTQDIKVKSLKAHVKGLGLDKDLVLTRGQTTVATVVEPALGPTWVYNSPWFDIDPSKTGMIKVTIFLPDVGPVSDEYRTIG
jgi:hypothetical protein